MNGLKKKLENLIEILRDSEDYYAQTERDKGFIIGKWFAAEKIGEILKKTNNE